MKLYDKRSTSIPNSVRNTFLFQNNEINQKNIFLENNIELRKNKTINNFHSDYNKKFNLNNSLLQDLRIGLNSSISSYYSNKYKSDYQQNLNEKYYFSGNKNKNLKPQSVINTFIIHNVNSRPKTNSMNGSYYKRKNNSVIIVKEKKEVNSLFENHYENLNQKENIKNNIGSRKFININLENLKDLLDIKDKKEEKTKEELAPFSDNIYSLSKPFESYMNKTRADNQKNLLKAEELRKFRERGSRYSKKSLINEKLVLSNSDIIYNNGTNIIKDKEKKASLFYDDISNGVECGLECNIFESSNNNENRRYAYNENEKLIAKNIITNAKLRDDIKWEKLQPKSVEQDLLSSDDIYSSELVEGRNEIFKLFFNNRINYMDSRYKLKTPNDLKSKIGNQNKIRDNKKIISAKPTKIINNIYLNSYAKENEIFENKYNTQMNSYDFNQIYKQSLQLKNRNSNDSTSKNKKRNFTNKDNILTIGNIEDDIKILKKRVFSPINNNIIVYNNIAYNLKNPQKVLNNDKIQNPVNLNNNYHSQMNMNKKTYFSLKAPFDIYFNQNESHRKIPFKDNCNNSNGFNNLAETKKIDTNNISKNLNSGRNKNSYLENYDKPLNRRLIERNEFLDKVNWRENKSVKIIKYGKSTRNYISNNKSKKEFMEEDYKHKELLNKCIPNITKSQYYINDTSKYKFKVLKKQLIKDSERVFNLVDNLKIAQSNLIDSKKKFLIESTDNKLKRHKRSSMRSSV